MSGTIPLSLTQQLDEFGAPLSGGLLYVIQAGTVSTPQNPYQDTGLSILMPNPITLDAAGRIPQFFLADGQIKVRLQDKFGVVKFTADNLLVIGPSGGGGGGGGTVDPTTVLTTGDIKVRYDVAVIAGFVRCNGRTIGSASSGASELADPSAQALFNFLWLKDPNLVVSPGGRGVSAAADWSANKNIAAPDYRGRAIAGLDDMGNAAAGRMSTAGFGVAGTVLGAASGAELASLNVSQLPAHQHNVYLKDPGHTHAHNAQQQTNNASTNDAAPVAIPANAAATISPAVTGMTVGSVNGVANDNLTAASGSGAGHTSCQPTMLLTVYMKL
jgi:microcystin-dependent protein